MVHTQTCVNIRGKRSLIFQEKGDEDTLCLIYEIKRLQTEMEVRFVFLYHLWIFQI